MHGLVVDRAMSGRGVGAALLRWVEDRAHDDGRSWVRLDCVTSNARLRRYYEELGFVVVRERSVGGAGGRADVVLLEKRVAAGGDDRVTDGNRMIS